MRFWKKREKDGESAMWRYAKYAVVAVCVIGIGANSISVIPTGYTGVKSTFGKISEKEVKTFSQGMELANGDKLQPAQLDIISYSEKDDTSKVRVIIHEGKYHQVRRMFGAVSQRVLELDRVKIGLLELDDTLERGEYRKLTEEELNLIK